MTETKKITREEAIARVKRSLERKREAVLNKSNVNVEAENSPVENSSQASKLAKVPVIVMIAMSPAMMNGKLPAEGLPDMNGAKVEYVTPTPEMAEELLAMATPAEFEAAQVNQENSDPMGISELK